MSVLEKITVKDFRNIAFAELSFSPRINCICGSNGQGKTNLLDAIHYLSLARSAFSSSDAPCFRYGTDSFAVSGLCRMPDSIISRFTLNVTKGGSKVMKRDDKAYARLSAHLGAMPAVMVSPQDSSLVSESGQERRRFVDAVLSQTDPQYLAALQKYNRALTQRNCLLKETETNDDLLDVLDVSMASSAAVIVAKRDSFAVELNEAVVAYYSSLSGSQEEVSIVYRPDLGSGCGQDAALASFKSARKRDHIMKYTTVGVQRDEFEFNLNGYPIRKYGSQGQQKSFLVALKLAQYDIMKRRYGFPPVLLLDDVFDKLDADRMSNMLKLVCNGDYGQIFITDTNRERMESIVRGLSADAKYFEARNGEF